MGFEPMTAAMNEVAFQQVKQKQKAISQTAIGTGACDGI